MSHVLVSLKATAKSVAASFSSRSSRRVSDYLLYRGHHDAPRWQQRHIAARLFHQGRRYSSGTPRKISDPLDILFCGSDEFSCASLKALHDEHVRNPGLIRSIDVVVRPGKPTGRGQKIIRHPPIRILAESLGLPVHERDTFTGWNMPSKTNLIIAVSFGLFVPPRLLREAKYGGLNIHPSLLPDLRGPAPLQHTLLSRREVAGVTLQTLDHAAFDHGVILAQTPSDPRDAAALRIPASCTTVADLLALVTPAASSMLVHGLREGLHVPPLEPPGRDLLVPGASAPPLPHAPKIRKEDLRLTAAMAASCTSGDGGLLSRRSAVLGPLWFMSRPSAKNIKKRVIIEGLEELPSTNPPSTTTFTTTSSNSPFPPSPSLSTGEVEEFPAFFVGPHDPYDPGGPRRTMHLVPFFDEDEDEEHIPHKPRRYLAFWEHGRPSRRQEECGWLCLGNYRIFDVKVEGGPVKSPRAALQSFIVATKYGGPRE